VQTVVANIGAAVAEIAGCLAFRAWLLLDKPVWWGAPGLMFPALFACLPTLVESKAAGRRHQPDRQFRLVLQ
jgi:small multidrug resistance family-3 protein